MHQNKVLVANLDKHQSNDDLVWHIGFYGIESVLNTIRKIFKSDRNGSGFRCCEVSHAIAKQLIEFEGFTRVFQDQNIQNNEERVLGFCDGITFFQSRHNNNLAFYSGNWGCDGSLVS